MAPWRILEQALTVLTPDKEPGFTMQFSINPANSAECRLRIVMPDMDADALELTFNTGGLLVEQVYQPRILKPFQRGPIVVPPEPEERPAGKNGEMVLVNPLTNQAETDDERARREKLAALKEAREPTEAPAAEPAKSGKRGKTVDSKTVAADTA